MDGSTIREHKETVLRENDKWQLVKMESEFQGRPTLRYEIRSIKDESYRGLSGSTEEEVIELFESQYN